jgi:hypothetical protein
MVQVVRRAFVLGVVGPLRAMPLVDHPDAGLTPCAHSRWNCWKLGPVAVPEMGTGVPGLNTADTFGTRGGTGLVIFT